MDSRMIDDNNSLVSRRKVLQSVGVASAASLAGCSSGGENSSGDEGTSSGESANWVMGTSEQGTSTFSIGQALQSVIREQSDRVNLSAQSSGGQVANARSLGSDYDLAIISNNLHYDALQETGPFAEQPPSNPLWAGFSVTGAECFMLTKADSDIETFDDLQGRTITTFGTGSALYQLTMTVFEELGIKGEYEHREIPLNEFGSALENGRIEACGGYTTLRGTSASGGMQELMNRVDLKAVKMTDEQREQVSDITSPPIETIQPEPFENIDQVTAWTDTANVIYGDHLPEELVEHTTRTWIENWDQVKDTYGGVLDATDEALVSGLLPSFTLHPGAAAYLESRGISLDEWAVGSQ
ncbi:TAXI family TRAP transporter solute-binding subunit [Halobellus rubicundus]|uniref:TAXI family TRAP transporter solute-binding subunit n=1 Tax=Halobellus rubicundus TaxID=2996466 RepID=A0ABD5MHQ9_9EURY